MLRLQFDSMHKPEGRTHKVALRRPACQSCNYSTGARKPPPKPLPFKKPRVTPFQSPTPTQTTQPTSKPQQPTNTTNPAISNPTKAATASSIPIESQKATKSGKPQLSNALRAPNRAKPLILAIGSATVIVLGTWYGAGLKVQQEFSTAKEVQETAALQTVIPPTAVVSGDTSGNEILEAKKLRIAALEGSRARLVHARNDLSKKIGRAEDRMRKTVELEDEKRRLHAAGGLR